MSWIRSSGTCKFGRDAGTEGRALSRRKGSEIVENPGYTSPGSRFIMISTISRLKEDAKATKRLKFKL